MSRTFTVRSRFFSTYAFVYSEEGDLREDATLATVKTSCFWHLLIWLVAICGAILSILLSRSKKAQYIVIASEIIATAIFAILGSCIWDIVACAAVIVVALLQWLLFIRSAEKENIK